MRMRRFFDLLLSATIAVALSCDTCTAWTQPSPRAKRHATMQRRQLAILPVLLLLRTPPDAHAAYGSGAAMELPSYIDYLIEQSKTVDPDSLLYQQSQYRDAQLQRLQLSTQRLLEIPALAEQKKWNAIQSLLTGPLGEMGSTMTKLSGNAASANLVKTVKTDLYQISTGAVQKRGDLCKQAVAKTLVDLEAFLKQVM